MSSETEQEIKTVYYKEGATVYLQDSRNEGFFYIVKSGKLQSQADIKFQDNGLNYYEKGDTFGLVSGLTGNPHRATLVAQTDCEIVRVPLSRLGGFFRENRNTSLKLISLYSRQLRALDEHLVRKERALRGGRPERLFDDALVYDRMLHPHLACYTMTRFLQWVERSGKLTEKRESALKFLHRVNAAYQMPVRDSNKILLKEREVIFVENEPSDFFYIIIGGTVKISKLVSGNEVLLAVLGEGEIFGEMAVLNQEVRNATAVAMVETELLRLSSENFLDEVGEIIIQKIFESFARRIWYSHHRVMLLEIEEPIVRLYAILQLLISDATARGRQSESERFIFNLTMDDLKQMTGISDTDEKEYQDFLFDENIRLAKHTIVVESRTRLEEQMAHYRSRIKGEHLRNILV